jgi:hypothetical protein
MAACTDPSVGDLLHAYEINTLSDDEKDRFEVHLMSCENCLNELHDFSKVTSLLRSDSRAKAIFMETEEKRPQTASRLKKLWRYLWPETPFFFKPALAYLLVLLMFIPAYLGWERTEVDTVHSVQSITLFPDRSPGGNVFSINSGKDGLITFVFKASVIGRSYQVVIEDEAGSEIYRDNDFSDFDELNTGRLILPLTKMNPGNYRLSITDHQAEPPYNRREYSFRVDE